MQINESLIILRIIGGLFGSVVAMWGFARFRRHLIRRAEFALIFLFGLAVLVISIAPDTVNVAAGMVSMDDRQYGRLIMLLIFSNLLLWMLVFGLRIKDNTKSSQFDRLVRQMGIAEFRSLYPEIRFLPPVVVIIPAYNEADNIGIVLKMMPKSVCNAEVKTIVIDDGSDDNSFKVALEFGALAVKSMINRGGGAALRMGFDIARQYGADVVVTMDADGQHLPTELENVVEPILSGEFDFVIGSRILGNREKDSIVRYIGIYVFNAMIRLLTPVKITDCSSGFRAIRTVALKRVFLQQDQFHTSEYIIEAAKKGLRIVEVPITVKRRLSGRSKKGKSWYYGLNFARTLFKTWWR